MAEKADQDMNEEMSSSTEMRSSMDKEATEPMEGDEEMNPPMEGEMDTSTEKASHPPMKRGTEESMGTS
jgi:hypothetical protein